MSDFDIMKHERGIFVCACLYARSTLKRRIGGIQFTTSASKHRTQMRVWFNQMQFVRNEKFAETIIGSLFCFWCEPCPRRPFCAIPTMYPVRESLRGISKSPSHCHGNMATCFLILPSYEIEMASSSFSSLSTSLSSPLSPSLSDCLAQSVPFWLIPVVL